MRKKDSAFLVHLSEDTMRGILLEVSRHPTLECIVQMPGVRKGNDFFFDLVADSGIKATYAYGMCEKDHRYVDHLSTRLAEYYQIDPKELTVSQVHKHPPGYGHFSPGDRPANQSLARQFGGVVNGLILVNPRFQLRFWYIDPEGNEYQVPYLVDEEGVKEAMPRKEINDLRELVEQKEHPEIFYRKGQERREQEMFPLPGKRRKRLEVLTLGKKRESDRNEAGRSIRALRERNGPKAQEGIKTGKEAQQQLLEEVRGISRQTDIYGKKFPDGTLLMHAVGGEGEKVYFRVITRGEELWIAANGKEQLYWPGVIRTLLKMEGEENGRAKLGKDGTGVRGMGGFDGGKSAVYGVLPRGVSGEVLYR